MRRRATGPMLLLAIAILLGSVAGCGDGADQPSDGGGREFTLALDFFVNADHAGIYEGIERGNFADAGLDVEPRVPTDVSAPIKQVATGRADLAISYEPELMLARDAGLDVVAVAALVHDPLTSLISLPEAGIDDPGDLEDKRVVTAGIPYQTAFLETILRDAGVDPDSVEQTAVGLDLLKPVLSGSADAMLGGFSNVEGVELAERGAEPRVVPVDELGIPPYDELVLVASAEAPREDPESIRAFLAALERGTLAARDDPQEAADAIIGASEGLDPELTRAEVDATIPALLAPEGKPFGYMDPKGWESFARFLEAQGQIDEAEPAREMLTNELLPGGGGTDRGGGSNGG